MVMIFSGLAVSSYAQSAGPGRAAPEAALTAEVLAPAELQAFSHLAPEKIATWLAYLDLCRQAKGDSLLEWELRQYLLRLFLNEDISLTTGTQLVPLTQWLPQITKREGPSVTLAEFQWLDGWQTAGPGLMRRTAQIELLSGPAEVPAWAGMRRLTLYLRKETKTFGRERQDLWVMRLGELR